MGAHNSLAKLLCDDIPNLFIMKCVCHSFALCASYACKKLPDSCEILLRDVFKYFKYSSKKYCMYQEFQKFFDVKPHKLLYPAQTRWLSLVAVVRRVLEQWEPLKLFFLNEVLNNPERNVDTAQNIHIKLKNIFQ